MSLPLTFAVRHRSGVRVALARELRRTRTAADDDPRDRTARRTCARRDPVPRYSRDSCPLVSRVTGRKIAPRNAFALFAYAATPIVLSLVIVFPIEIAVFGVYLFDTNPPPMVLNPIAFIVLVGLDVHRGGVVGRCLLGIGIRVMAGCGRS